MVAAALVTVAALAVTAIAILRDDGGAPREAPRPTSASLSPELMTQVLDQARPTGVEVRDEQTAVTVRWSRSSRSNDQHLVQVLAVDAGMQPRTEPVAGQRDEVRVEGLDPNIGYCFRIGAVIFWDSPAVVAWSDSRCVRGATIVMGES
ncbi:fibronectin type III domain-containing protein [Micromonospora sonneratiae]|uniref:Fibronectin type-III domain-containing protein n=1 Tax=Micromonospora sonneratiae TaxID=1184706 RepID=A0ABW3Y9I8_9ACTN